MDALKNGWSAGSPSQKPFFRSTLLLQWLVRHSSVSPNQQLRPFAFPSVFFYIGTRMTRDSARRASSSAREKNGGNSGDSPSSTSEVGHLTHVTFNWKTGIILRKKLKIGSTVSLCSTGLLYNKTGKVSTSQT